MGNIVKESKDLATVAVVTRDKVLEFMQAFGLVNQLNSQEAEQFISIAQEFQLNPFKREIHCVPYGEGTYRKLSIIVGYETYIKRAERTGKLDGWKAWTEGSGEQMKAKVEIHRKDWHTPFLHEVPWTEAAQKKKDGTLTPFWQKMPCFQLKKVAISQAFRLAFPDELGGLPYSSDELGIPVDQLETPTERTGENHQDEVTQQVPDLPTGQTLVIGIEPVPESPQIEAPGAIPDVFGQLDAFLDEHDQEFTTKHLDWIKHQVEDCHTLEKAGQMLKYARRFIKEQEETAGGDPYNLRRYRQFTTSPAVMARNNQTRRVQV